MTPRERLEAAGWKARYPEAEARWFSPDISDSATYSQKEALAQLARDGAKETSDGSVKEKVQLETVSVPYVSSPVAGNVATQGYAQNSVQAAPVATSVFAPDVSASWFRDQNYNRGMVELLKLNEGKPVLAHQIETWLMNEYASSSSAALHDDLVEEVRYLRSVRTSLDERSKSDAICIEALKKMVSMGADAEEALRDSRDMLHEEFDVMRLRALSAEKIARIPIRTQDEEFIARRAALGDPK